MLTIYNSGSFSVPFKYLCYGWEKSQDLYVKDVIDKDDSTILEIELPGIPKEDIKITSINNRSMLKQEIAISWKARDGSILNKKFSLSDHDMDRIDSTYKDGLLRIKIFKPASKSRDIPIK